MMSAFLNFFIKDSLQKNQYMYAKLVKITGHVAQRHHIQLDYELNVLIPSREVEFKRNVDFMCNFIKYPELHHIYRRVYKKPKS